MIGSKSDSASPLQAATDGTRSIRFNSLIAAFAGHLVAWSGYVAMHISYESYFVGRPWVTSLLGFAFAAAAAFCALIIGRALPRRFRLGFALISLIVVLGSGISELLGLVFYDVDSSLADAMAVALSPLVVLPFVGELAYPFILFVAVMWTMRVDTCPAVSKQETMPSDNVGSQRTDPANGKIAFIIYCVALTVGVATTAFLTFIFFSPVSDLSDEGWDKEFIWLTAAGIIGAIGLIGVYRHLSTTAIPAAVSTTIEVTSLFAMVFAHQLSSLSVAQAVYSDSVGIGGMALWTFVVFMFPFAATVLLIVTLAVTAFSRRRWSRSRSGHL